MKRQALISLVMFGCGALTAVLAVRTGRPPAPEAVAPAPAPVALLPLQCAPVWAWPEESSFQKLQTQLEQLDQRVAQLAEAIDRSDRPTFIPVPAVHEPAVAAAPGALPVTVPPPVISAPPQPAQPDPDPVTAKLETQLDALTRAAEDRTAQREAERQAVAQLNGITGRLALGETAGIAPVLESAAASLGGAAADELRAASRSLANEDLVTARQHIELVLLNAR